MRHRCVPTALLVSSGASFARSSVDLYGIADLGLRVTSGLNGSNAPALPGRSSAVGSGVDHTSRRGIKGQESPGGGRKARFRLEGGINVDQTGKRFAAFNPNINVAGPSNTAFGSHAFGRQYGAGGYADN